MDVPRFEHHAILDERGEPAQTCLHPFRSMKTLNHQVAQGIEPYLELHPDRAPR